MESIETNCIASCNIQATRGVLRVCECVEKVMHLGLDNGDALVHTTSVY